MFERGFTIGRVHGIPIRIHISLLLFLPYVAVLAARQMGYVERSLDVPPGGFHLPPLAWGVLLAVGLFAAVVVHELAHSLDRDPEGRPRPLDHADDAGRRVAHRGRAAARSRRRGWRSRARSPASRSRSSRAGLYRVLPLGGEASAALFVFASTNAALGVFNLLPAFPMDGGRVVRGLLAGRLGQGARDARRRAGSARRWPCSSPSSRSSRSTSSCSFIAWFVYMGAGAEEQRRVMLHALRDVPLTELMSDRIGAARADETVGEVLRRVVRGGLAGAEVLERRRARRRDRRGPRGRRRARRRGRAHPR